jgi:hypothetical protein
MGTRRQIKAKTAMSLKKSSRVASNNTVRGGYLLPLTLTLPIREREPVGALPTECCYGVTAHLC